MYSDGIVAKNPLSLTKSLVFVGISAILALVFCKLDISVSLDVICACKLSSADFLLETSIDIAVFICVLF